MNEAFVLDAMTRNSRAKINNYITIMFTYILRVNSQVRKCDATLSKTKQKCRRLHAVHILYSIIVLLVA